MTVRAAAVFGMRFLQPRASLVLLMATVLWSGAALAQDEAEEDGTPRFIVPPEPTRPYLDAIDRIEEEYGPYASELSDLYLGLGEEYLKEGDYEGARDAYHRGVMVVRVNSGPNSPDQTNLLYLIANIETILGEEKQANKILDSIRFINTNYYDEDSPELLPVYERLYEWYHTARPLDLEESEYTDYLRMVDLTDEMVKVSDAVHGAGHPETALAYRRLAEAHFQAMRFAVYEDEWVQPRVIVASDIPYQTTPGLDDYSMREHYIQGRDAFRRYLEILKADPSKTALDYAEGVADLADWSLHFQKYRSARKLYEEAYQVLAQSPEYAELVDSYLGQPRPMDFAAMETGVVDGVPLDPDARRVDVSMTVTRIGDVRYVKVLNPPEGMSDEDITDIKRTIQDTPFRPSLKGGKATTTEGFIWQHVIRAEAEEEIRPEERTS